MQIIAEEGEEIARGKIIKINHDSIIFERNNNTETIYITK